MPAILTARQQLVLRLRFGPDRSVATHAQVAETMGVSRETVRRLERNALRRLRVESVDPSVDCFGWDEVWRTQGTGRAQALAARVTARDQRPR